MKTAFSCQALDIYLSIIVKLNLSNSCGFFKTSISELLAEKLCTDRHQCYTTVVTFPHHTHPLSHFYTIHCRPISSVDMTREKSQGQSRENQKPVSYQRATVWSGLSPEAHCDLRTKVSNGLTI